MRRIISHNLALLPIIGLLASLASAQGIAVSDTFDRPNSTDLGPDWIERETTGAGDARIQDNMFLANNGIFGFASHTEFQAAYVDTVVRADWNFNGVGYRMGLVAGANYSGNWEGIEVALADNTLFCPCEYKATRIFFNAAPGAGSWPAGPAPIGPGGWPIAHPPKWFDLATPVASGTLTIWFEDNGDTAVAEVKSDEGGIEVFRASGILNFQTASGFRPGPPTGTSVGITYEGRVTVDDFRAWTGTPDAGAVYAMNPPRTGRKATFLVTDAAANGVAGLFFSVTGTGPLPLPWGPLFLSPPIFQLAALPTDPNGRAEVTLPNVPASLQGLVMHNQALDALSLTLSNPFTTTFQ